MAAESGAFGRFFYFFEGQLSCDNLLESDIGQRGTWSRLDQRAMPKAKLAHTPGDDIDQQLLIWDHLSCFLQELSGHIAQRTDSANRLRWELKNSRRVACER